MAEDLFTVKNLFHAYQDRTILDIPFLSFEARKIHAITGPNGSGKTTLCSILGLLLRPIAGEIFYRGNSVYQNRRTPEAVRKRVTMLHQNPFLFSTSVEKNVAYGLRVRKCPRSVWEPKVEACLKLTGIGHLRRQRANCLSGGETQRVALARALAIDPEVIILDEFTANVDRNYAQAMESVIEEIFRQEGITIFLVTHDEAQALRIAHTATVLLEGKVHETISLPKKA